MVGDELDLDELAARGRERREQRKPGATPRRAKLSEREKLIQKSLAGDQSKLLLLLLPIFAAPWLAFEFMDLEALGISRTVMLAAMGGVTLVCGVLAVVWMRQHRAAAATRERADLEQLPLPFDLAAYLDILGTSQMKLKVVLRAKFDTKLDPPLVERVNDAAHALLATGTARCSSKALILESDALATWFRSRGDNHNSSDYSNRLVHAWVRDALGVLKRIHQDHAIVGVTIERSTGS